MHVETGALKVNYSVPLFSFPTFVMCEDAFTATQLIFRFLVFRCSFFCLVS